MKHLAVSLALSILVMACGLLAYDRLVARPAQLVAVVDVAEVFRAKETEFASLLTASKTEEERAHAMEMAARFAKRLPVAMDELPVECGCLVMVKSAVAGRNARTIDLTPVLRSKIEAAR